MAPTEKLPSHFLVFVSCVCWHLLYKSERNLFDSSADATKNFRKRRIFSERLSLLMTERGTQGNLLAAAIGASESAVNQWKSGAVGCKGSNLVKVAHYFSVPVQYLTGAIDHVPSRTAPLREGNLESIDEWRVRAIRAEERLENAIRQIDAMADALKTQARQLQNGQLSVSGQVGSYPFSKSAEVMDAAGSLVATAVKRVLEQSEPSKKEG